MSQIQNTYRYLQAFSVDVMLGALVMTWFAASISNIELPVAIYVTLGLSVWLVYTIDHLIDAKTITGEAVTLRHRLHQRYFQGIGVLWIITFIIALVYSLMILPIKTIYFGIFTAGVVIVHLVLVRLMGTKTSKFIQKETGVALAYTFGIMMGPVSVMSDVTYEILSMGIQVFLLALINLYLFSFFDHEVDEQHNQTSVTRNLGSRITRQLILTLIAVLAIVQGVSLLWLPQTFHAAQGILALMLAGLSALLFVPSYFGQSERFRVLGDMVFLFPSALLLF